jgi:hypothetical protein
MSGSQRQGGWRVMIVIMWSESTYYVSIAASLTKENPREQRKKEKKRVDLRIWMELPSYC